MSAGKGKGKAEASPSQDNYTKDMYVQTLLSNTHFTPQTMFDNQRFERLWFGKQI